MTARTYLVKLGNWIFRNQALRGARAGVPDPTGRRGRAARQARLLVEVARRVAEPAQPLPSGSRAAVLLPLYRDAIHFALLALEPNEPTGPRDLEALWAAYPPETWLRYAPDATTVDVVKAAVLDPGVARNLDAGEGRAASVGKFAEALLAELDQPEQRVHQVLAQRWLRVLVVSAAVLLLGGAAGARVLGPNIAKDKPFRTSSSWAGCAGDSDCSGMLFHTDDQADPWVEFDLGAARTFHRIEVKNRSDFADRAVPLVAEIGNDRVHWTEVARRDQEFSRWTAKLPATTARYVRLRVARRTVFHLKSVAIR